VLDELTTGLDPQARRDTWELIGRMRARGVTIVLVTHFMEEAERLCDRVALIDSGRLVVVDTPAALTDKVEVEQRIAFRPSEPMDDALLASLPDITGVVHPRRPRGGHRQQQRPGCGHFGAGQAPDRRPPAQGRPGQPGGRVPRPDRQELDRKEIRQ
jgi:ABC-type multidrug transport system ATPase subunit